MITSKNRAAAAAIAVTAAALLGPAGAALTAAPAVAAPSAYLAAAPSAGELQAKLQLALNRGAARADRAAELEVGEAGLPIIDQVAAIIDTLPGYQWSIVGPVDTEGDRTTAQLKTVAPGYPEMPLVELSWRQVDGKWKLSRESLCKIAGFAGLPCNV
ncbi:hypothetical protein [Nocardia arthritidis]|uniref:Low molecular weight antigen MTB12-like C-terminal domain-containing protein n=1 Tax=Nocardia arthritidis TaxID=228602 RepID=A0A6G9Y700_9NOCA|nr:hypothetical protein [Nocardia arthritidis]QIS08914.1 hypothetical protein F5544_05010 [Nocardia arthritidis]